MVNETIRTERLKIEPFSKEFLTEKIVRWLNDPEVVRYSDQRHKKHTLETSQSYLESFAGSPNCYWAVIVLSMPDVMIGTITAYINEPNLVADIGILIGEKEYWRGGYGSEAFAAVVDWLVTRRRMRKVTAGTMAENMSMRGVMRKVGMHEEGRRERYYILGGREVDMIYVTVFAEDWDHISRRGKR